MHIIEVNHGAGELHRYLLLPDAAYTVGRKECHILLPTGDPSISRHHANIQVGVMQSRALTDPSVLTAEVSLQDNSKHGTLVNDEHVGRGNCRYIYTEDSIKFGKKVTARVVSVRIVLVESSQLLHDERKALRNVALLLGALIVQEPAPLLLDFFDMRLCCTAFLYITHNGYTVTPETLLAQQRGYHITTVKYLQSLENALSEDCARGMEELPQPTAAQPGDTSFQVTEYMRPPKVFYDIHEFLLSKPLPNKLLRSYTFVFPDVEIMEKYEVLLKHCGAVVAHQPGECPSEWQSLDPDSTSVIVAGDDMFFKVKRVALTKPERNGTPESEETNGGNRRASALGEDPKTSVYVSLYENGFVIIPEKNIMRAAFTGNPLEINGRPSAPYLARSERDTFRSPSPMVRAPSHGRTSNNHVGTLPCRGASADPVVMAAEGDEKPPRFTVSPPPRRASSVSDGAAKSTGVRVLQELEGNILRVVDVNRLGGEGENDGNACLSKSTSSFGGGGGTSEVTPTSRKKHKRKPSASRASEEGSQVRAASVDSSSARSQGQYRDKSPEGLCPSWEKQGAVVVHTAEQLWKTEGGRISSSRARMSAYKMSRQSSFLTSATPSSVGAKPHVSTEKHGSEDGQPSQPRSTPSRSMRSVSPLTKRSVVGQSASRRLAPRQALTKLFPCDELGSHSTLGGTSIFDVTFCHTARCESSGRHAKRQLLTHWHRTVAKDKVRETKSARLPASPLRSFSPLFQRYNSGTGSSRRGAGSRGSSAQKADGGRGERYAGLFSSSVSSSNGASAALLAQQQDVTIRKRCEEFLRKVLTPLNTEVDTICKLIMKQGYLDAESKKKLEIGAESLIKFLTYIQRVETSIPPAQSTESTRTVTNQVRQKSLLLRRRIKGAYESVKAEIPPWMNQLREVLSVRPLVV
ncbi:recombination initiation protein NBS1, putative [Trypanosoma brucei gambiense DAL972]|uniref:Recombination initiation protein NBS1, putative n=1 Tax=Trypanosoma brucei gambiense (strain MHOM/CI/86/DAL972) TaxID=679716 RepID=C9ZW44_TRYB9|nr:recombination initiation protein NBS1, putative [Trypanosoma brucei gambiense DAL972]CBH13633.1 recombination initiation protein NBS1, putative [Trypanosoma brucei gambiense DAL972]|eukprot:XP_011775909.1 recombination initiation protein NBS1, putative [Trypanosoma brucei gambiense DAL972]